MMSEIYQQLITTEQIELGSIMKFRRSFICVPFLTLIFASCGGGGGGEDACESYCAFACAKAILCLTGGSNGQQDCESSCNETTDRLNRGDDSCRSAQAGVESQNCDQLLTTLGLKTNKSQFDIVAEELGFSLGEALE